MKLVYLGAFVMTILFAIGWYLSPLNESGIAILPPETKQASILFGGDMMFDRTIRSAMETNGDDHVLSCLDPILEGHDLVVANLEGPITNYPSVSQYSRPNDSNNFTFTFATSTATLLKRHGIDLVNLGNNHIMNFRRDGLLETKRWLDAAGVRYFGDPDVLDHERVARVDIKGIPFSFVNWSDWTSDNTDITAATVRDEAQKGRIVVVYTHWGEEYVPATDRQKRLARNLVDEGASIIIGSHPHIVQESEIYKGKYIYYSLGNMVFDQYWMESVSNGLLLEVTFTGGGVESVREISIRLQRDGRTCPIGPLSYAQSGKKAGEGAVQ